MKVFISFSGERSKAVAVALREFLGNMLQMLEPWYSEEIGKGRRWSQEIAEQLEKTQFGIVCLTPENLTEPWIHFEAGACSKSVKDDARVVPYLYEVRRTDVTGPLAAFQMCNADSAGTRSLVEELNKLLGERARTPDQLQKGFEKWWEDLRQQLSAIAPRPTAPPPVREVRDLVEEILERVRRMEPPARIVTIDTEAPIFHKLSDLRRNTFEELLNAVQEHSQTEPLGAPPPAGSPNPPPAIRRSSRGRTRRGSAP